MNQEEQNELARKLSAQATAEFPDSQEDAFMRFRELMAENGVDINQMMSGPPAVRYEVTFQPGVGNLGAEKVNMGGIDVMLVRMTTPQSATCLFFSLDEWRAKVAEMQETVSGIIVPTPTPAGVVDLASHRS